MKLTITYNFKPTIDILVAVANRGGGENCINMLGRFLVSKGWRVRVVQMVYEGSSWAAECMEFNYVYTSRNDHDVQDFIDGYSDFIKKNGSPNLSLATAWPMMSYVAKMVSEGAGEKFLVASWLHAPLKMYEISNFGGGDFVKYADLHFAISNEIANAIKAADPKAVIYRINNPADLSKIHQVEIDKPGTLLFVGRLSLEKNIGIMISAIAKAHTDWKLILVGDGDEKRNLKRLARQFSIQDKVDFIGWSDDPWKYAEGAYAIGLSSMYEGSPLVAIEALSCGLPVIANVSSRCNEIIQPGINGYLYPDNDIDEFAKILDMISEGKFPKITSEACRSTVPNYDAGTALFDFYIKLHATINGRLITGYTFPQQGDFIIDDKISVVIPCYNVEKYVGRCLDSVLDQTIGKEHLEIIAVNDCSTDGTLQILEDYEKRYPANICIINCEENGGLSKARNIGLSYVSGSYVTFIDSDDYIAPTMLERMMLSEKCYPSDVVTCDFDTFSDNDPVKPQPKDSTSDFTLIENDNDFRQLFVDNAFLNPAWSKLIKSSFLLPNDALRFPEGYRMEDVFFTYQAVAYSSTWQHMSDKFYHYYQNNEGIMKSEKIKNYYMDIHNVFAMTMDRFKNMGVFDTLKDEIAYVYYKKVFENIVSFMKQAFDTMPTDNLAILVDYIKENFPDIKENRYLSDDEKKSICEFLG